MFCPSSTWTYDATACKCSCSVDHCEIPGNAINPYGCNCIPNNGCEKNQDFCGPLNGTILLDYDACACKNLLPSSTTVAP